MKLLAFDVRQPVQY